MSFFELAMLICFAAAWPTSIYKSYKSRTAKGKSLPFMVILLVGYVMGILHKVFHSFDLVIIMYIANLCMVSIDVGLYFRNRKLDANREEEIIEVEEALDTID